MTRTTNGEPPTKKAKQTGKQLALAIKKPEVLANRDKMPLHLMKDAFKFLTREEQEALRPVCQFWNRCMVTRPSHFGQLFKLDDIFCDTFDPGQRIPVDRERHWLDIVRPLNSCNHLEGLARKMVGQHFIPALEADVQIVLQLQVTANSKWIYYHFPNELTEETARHALHFCSHLREAAFDGIHDWKTGAFLLGMHPEIGKLFLPMRCRCMNVCVDPSKPSMPTLKSLLTVAKHQDILFYFAEAPPPPAQVKDALEKFAVNTRHLYKKMEIGTYCADIFDENHLWTALFRTVIELISKTLKDSREIVPRIDFGFDDGSPDWPLLPFSDMEPICEEKDYDGMTERTFEFKIVGGSSAKTFKAVVDCEENENEEEEGWDYASHITFLLN